MGADVTPEVMASEDLMADLKAATASSLSV